MEINKLNSMKNRVTFDDLLERRSPEEFKVVPDSRKGGIRVIKKKKKIVPLLYRNKYPIFFRLVGDNPSIPLPDEEFKFHPTRRWRLDLCWPDQKLALEIEGGTYISKGGHRGSITGYMKDMEKYNALSILGYSLLRFTPQQMESCESYDFLREWFKNNANRNSTTKIRSDGTS